MARSLGWHVTARCGSRNLVDPKVGAPRIGFDAISFANQNMGWPFLYSL